MKIGLQMYSLREEIHDAESLLAALKKVKELGYEGVEFAGYFGADAAVVKKTLDELGLTVVACHEGVDSLEANMDSIIEYNHAIGNPWIICAYSPTENMEQMERLQRVLEQTAEKAAAYGMKVMYHNHAHEFKPIDGKRPLDMIKEYCLLELDTYWAFMGGVDPAAYIKENAARIGTVHLKDGNRQGDACAIGNGEVDVQSIIDAGNAIGLEWGIVEVESETVDVDISIRNLRANYKL
ncbi:MAG TPA: sugar phosphate isomerase/epimerase [Candidatus Gallacutalibacter stercoravium]|nr:sugar phosphate isomerase/epimerase [Candidatus Gallacutalibacter stercoravium]